VAGRPVANRFVGLAFAGEHGVLGLHGLVGTGQTGDLDELTKELPAEDAVVIELLISALELGHGAVGRVVSGALRRHRIEIKASE
jgi:hypothetical protein